jgi:exosome complex component RRP4
MEKYEAPKREIVIPGMVLSTDPSLIPGRGAVKSDDKLLSIFVGLKEIRGKYINVVPLNGLYNPQMGDKIIAKIIDKTPVKWLVDINSKYLGTLRPGDAVKSQSRGRGYGKSYGSYQPRSSNDLNHFKIGDIVICKILTGSRLSEPELTTLGQELGLIRNGSVITISPPKIPRVIGKKGSMIALLKDLLHCKIFVAQNGRIWYQGKSFEHEHLLVDAVHKIEREAHTTGLTDRIKNYLETEKKNRGIE